MAQESLGSFQMAAQAPHKSNLLARRYRSKGRTLLSEGSCLTPLTSDDEATDNDSTNTTIPKPNGEASRPGHGGYSLDAVLPLPLAVINSIKVGLGTH